MYVHVYNCIYVYINLEKNFLSNWDGATPKPITNPPPPPPPRSLYTTQTAYSTYRERRYCTHPYSQHSHS